MTRCKIGCALAAMSLSVLAVPAGATTIVRVADEVMVEEAPLVVVARVAAKGPTASGAPATEYRFAVEQLLKGTAGPELTVRVPGGMGADGIGRRIYGAPSFAAGERAILFLEPRPGGDYRILHLMQGAFREVMREGRSLAVRDLADVAEVSRGGALAPRWAAEAEPVRELEPFVRWIADTARGARRPADYRVALPGKAAGAGRIVAPFTLFNDQDTGLNIRWFEFDDGGRVDWRFGANGQVGVPGGGLDDFKAGLAAWNADSQTPIDYRFAGTTQSTVGLSDFDDINAIHFDDPQDELTNLTGNCTGTLALGGVGYFVDTLPFRGTQYHPVGEGDIVINDGLECFFADIANPSKAAEQLFGHELGHTLGIDHSCGNPSGPSCSNPTLDDALMRAFFHSDDRGARLNSDDLAAARALYRQGGGNQQSPPAAPSNLTAIPLSTSEVELAWQDNSNNETDFVVDARFLAGSFVPIGTVPANSTGAVVEELSSATGYVFRVRAVNAQGQSSSPSNEAQVSTNAVPGPCFPGAQALCLADGRFKVDVDWATDQGTSGKGQVAPNVASDDSGLFYFFDEANWELVVKLLNACPVNERFWVFAGGLTNVQVVLRVVDTETTAVRHYFNPQVTPFQPVQDTTAFATCP